MNINVKTSYFVHPFIFFIFLLFLLFLLFSQKSYSNAQEKNNSTIYNETINSVSNRQSDFNSDTDKAEECNNNNQRKKRLQDGSLQPQNFEEISLKNNAIKSYNPLINPAVDPDNLIYDFEVILEKSINDNLFIGRREIDKNQYYCIIAGSAKGRGFRFNKETRIIGKYSSNYQDSIFMTSGHVVPVFSIVEWQQFSWKENVELSKISTSYECSNSGASIKNNQILSRTPEEIQLVFDRTQGAFYAIYLRALRDSPGLSGKIVLSLTIASNGKVTSVEIKSSELGNPDFENKIISRIKLMNFGARDVPTFIYPNYPISFKPPA